MQTVTIDIINTKAVKLLQDLEELDLIHIHKDDTQSSVKRNSVLKYKGAMTKQPLDVIENQLDEFRNGWE
ncbi:hypothetical protein [Dyadobacter sp. CY356]|uniref:hypothetical protein n=1 Tax=Dyadobacter sp. CY356 TaxID=2906442 RepID=UPI001F24E6D8|nr:hypothetical protein [Dyadobacter sp. CY356]MCF0056735.1 hypothetical protein [Dyadobacter sp. CY356]